MLLFFFGFVMRGSGSPAQSDVKIEQAFKLRLVSEVAQESLVKITDKNNKEKVQAWFVGGECIWYEGVEDQASADEIADFMAEQGLNPIIFMENDESVRYQLVLHVAKSEEIPTDFLVALHARSEFFTNDNLNSEGSYLIGEYPALQDAEKAKFDFLSLYEKLTVQEVFKRERHYSIQLQDATDRKLINKINDVLKVTYKTLKIEKKKVCKGLASTKPHQ